MAVRRDRIGLARRSAAAEGAVNTLAGRIVATEYQGSYVKITIDIGSDLFVANVSDAAYFVDPVDVGDDVVATWKAEDVHVLSKVDTGSAGDPYLENGH